MKSTALQISETDHKHGYWRSSLLWIPLIICTSVLLIVDLIEIQTFSYDSLQRQLPLAESQPLRNKSTSLLFTIDQEGCRIPYLGPFDKSILEYIYKPDVINCTTNTTPPAIVTKEDNSIYISTENRKSDSVKCCAREFWRQPPASNQKDVQFTKSKNCVPLKNDKKNIIKHEEFITVECKIDENDYKYFFSFVPKSKVFPKIAMQNELKKHDYLSVLVIGIDAVSRLNFHRQMPKTINYLKKVLDAKEMLGYNKVEDNTYPNLMPVLNGLSESEIEAGCLKQSKNQRFDKCPFVWKMYNEKSYITAYGEDATYMGLFTYNRKGFDNLTTDYDYRVFDQVAVDEVGHNGKLNSDLCLGTEIRQFKFLNYTKEFALTFKDNPYFGFFWGVSIPHDYLNDPNLMDDSYLKVIQTLYENGGLDNTALIVMSDHGIRWGGIRTTYQGFLEERLPFLFVYTPPWFRNKYTSAWANLITNTKRLTTPFDLHETLVDLKNLQTLEMEIIRDRIKTMSDRNQTQRGYSLFVPVPKNRTCKAAEIPNHYCACQSFKIMKTDDSTIKKVAQFIVDEMNDKLTGYRDCATLKLNKIHSARKGVTATSQSLKHVSPDYTVTISTVPGNGTFEASVRVSDNAYELTGTISRTNMYGSQSRCISDFHLKLYCYCLNPLDTNR